jgi:hypothetical protein
MPNQALPTQFMGLCFPVSRFNFQILFKIDQSTDLDFPLQLVTSHSSISMSVCQYVCMYVSNMQHIIIVMHDII